MNNDFYYSGDFPDPFKGLNTSGTGAGQRGRRGGRLGHMAAGVGMHVSNAFKSMTGASGRAAADNKWKAYDAYTDKNPMYYSSDMSLPEAPKAPF